MPAIVNNNKVNYAGGDLLKHRLVLSILSKKHLEVINIRSTSAEFGLTEYEINLLELLEKITIGSRSKIDKKGIKLYYQPGFLEGGKVVHDCHPSRGIGYYLEALMILAPFCKTKLHARLRGVTNTATDPSVDRMSATGLPIMRRFLGCNNVEIKINRRGAPPFDDGEIIFKCCTVSQLKAVQLTEIGYIGEIKGTALSIKVSPLVSNRMVKAATKFLQRYTPHLFIDSSFAKARAHGYGICLTAKTSTGVVYCGEECTPVLGTNFIATHRPENLGKFAAAKLMQEYYRKGCIDNFFQQMTAIFMALSGQSSRIVFGTLNDDTIQFFNDIQNFFGVMFDLDNIDNEEGSRREHIARLSCTGMGYINLSHRE